VSFDTQNQAFNTLLFLYEKILEISIKKISAIRIKEKVHVSVDLTKNKVKAFVWL